MTDGWVTPVSDLAGVDIALARWEAAVTGFTEADARGPTLLPGWTRGHVLTHIARNADGQARMVAGALRNEVVAQYPGGDEQRANDIEVGAHRPVEELVRDLRNSQAALVARWGEVPEGAWDRLTAARAGVRSVRDGVLSRWRELWVHLIDLDVGVGPVDLPTDYLTRDRDWLAQYRTRATWPTATW